MKRLLLCHFCHGLFEELPFWGCCGNCYSRSATVRLLVDDAHPQTIRQQEPANDR